MDNKRKILHDLVTKCYSIERDDIRFRNIVSLPHDRQGPYFKDLRAKYPVRREFSATTVKVPSEATTVGRCLSDLGFTVEWTGTNVGTMHDVNQATIAKTLK